MLKLSRFMRWLSKTVEPKPLSSRKTHTAYTEAVHFGDGTYEIRVYSYDTGEMLVTELGKGDRSKASKRMAKIIKSYRRDN